MAANNNARLQSASMIGTFLLRMDWVVARVASVIPCKIQPYGVSLARFMVRFVNPTSEFPDNPGLFQKPTLSPKDNRRLLPTTAVKDNAILVVTIY